MCIQINYLKLWRKCRIDKNVMICHCLLLGYFNERPTDFYVFHFFPGYFKICISFKNPNSGHDAAARDHIKSFRSEFVQFGAKLNGTTLFDCSMPTLLHILLRERSTHLKDSEITDPVNSTYVTFLNGFVRSFHQQEKSVPILIGQTLYLPLNWLHLRQMMR